GKCFFTGFSGRSRGALDSGHGRPDLAGRAALPRLPRHPPAALGAGGGGRAGARHPRRHPRPRAADLRGPQPVHRLPDPGRAGEGRAGHAHPPRRRGALLPPRRGGRPPAPGLPVLRGGLRRPAGAGRGAGGAVGGAVRLPRRRPPPVRVRRMPGLPHRLGGMTSPLLSRPGAVAAEAPDSAVAAHYGEPAQEARALDRSAGWTDRSNRGVVRVAGPDRLSLLHSLTSQALEGVPAGTATEALLMDANGRVKHHMAVLDDGSATWLHTEPGQGAELAAFLDSMRFMLRVEVADATGERAVLTLAGPDRDEVLGKASGSLPEDLPVRREEETAARRASIEG